MTPLVFLPGMMCDERLFAPQIKELSKQREVHFSQISDYESISELASVILNNTPPVFALAGLSMGGIVAMEILSQAPERVERLALLDTNPLAELPEVAKQRQPQIDAIKKGHPLTTPASVPMISSLVSSLTPRKYPLAISLGI